jgi:squalene-hopene/tetraprenyl-beta-curcumene cyclase
MDPARLERAYQTARAALLAERSPDGYWIGELSTSALATATAVSALSLVQKARHSGEFSSLTAAGLAWLVEHQNEDGGWGDTTQSFSNISTTMLCRAALSIADSKTKISPRPPGSVFESAIRNPQSAIEESAIERSQDWLASRYGDTPEQIAEAVRARYGKDRTFSVPILMTSALAGLVPWREVPSLPFELACFPQSWYRFLRLPVVSYALPALIAIGQAVYHHRPPANPIPRLLRRASLSRSLRVLDKIQPASGGFLEATPLTSFVTLGLVSSGHLDHPVVANCIRFLTESVRPDGSWPIDTNLSTWVTTLAINALHGAGDLANLDQLPELAWFLINQQYKDRHPYTGADPGGWAWTPLSGGVPDADDTPGAILALTHLNSPEPRTQHSEPRTQRSGVSGPSRARSESSSGVSGPSGSRPSLNAASRWLLDLQNNDGGWPTFCKGWGMLPFDRSGSDLTAHALRALAKWGADPACDIPAKRISRASARGLDYLAREQRADGSWLPLWFGNQHAPGEENPTYGTARVLAAYRDLDIMSSEAARRGIAWLLHAQNPDGGWGGAPGTPSSLEETSLAVDVLLDAPGTNEPLAVNKALDWLVEEVEVGGLFRPAPIGFYFAKLWYFERLYPIIFATAALGRACRKHAFPQRSMPRIHPETSTRRG